MKILFSAIALLFLLSGCRTYSYVEDFRLPENSAKLPKLTVITDQEIFANDANEYSTSFSRSLGNPANLYMVERQFSKYILEHLTTWKTGQYGYAVLRVNHLKVRNDLPLFSVASIATLGATTILGIPAGRYRVEVDLSLEILDTEQNILGIYNGKGSSRAYIAMYYGYGEKEARDRCIYESLEMCFTHMNERIVRDFSYLESKLKEE